MGSEPVWPEGREGGQMRASFVGLAFGLDFVNGRVVVGVGCWLPF